MKSRSHLYINYFQFQNSQILSISLGFIWRKVCKHYICIISQVICSFVAWRCCHFKSYYLDWHSWALSQSKCRISRHNHLFLLGVIECCISAFKNYETPKWQINKGVPKSRLISPAESYVMGEMYRRSIVNVLKMFWRINNRSTMISV